MTAPFDQVKILHEAGLFSSSKLLVSVKCNLFLLMYKRLLIAKFTQRYPCLCDRLNPEIAEKDLIKLINLDCNDLLQTNYKLNTQPLITKSIWTE